MCACSCDDRMTNICLSAPFLTRHYPLALARASARARCVCGGLLDAVGMKPHWSCEPGSRRVKKRANSSVVVPPFPPIGRGPTRCCHSLRARTPRIGETQISFEWGGQTDTKTRLRRAVTNLKCDASLLSLLGKKEYT